MPACNVITYVQSDADYWVWVVNQRYHKGESTKKFL